MDVANNPGSPLRSLHEAEDSLRKLSRAVEQSADLVVITDRSGIIEYVNPLSSASPGTPGKKRSAAIPASSSPASNPPNCIASYGKRFSRATSFVEFWPIERKTAKFFIWKRPLLRYGMQKGESPISSPMIATSRSAAVWKPSSCRPRRWMPLANWRAALLMTSIIF